MPGLSRLVRARVPRPPSISHHPLMSKGYQASTSTAASRSNHRRRATTLRNRRACGRRLSRFFLSSELRLTNIRPPSLAEHLFKVVRRIVRAQSQDITSLIGLQTSRHSIIGGNPVPTVSSLQSVKANLPMLSSIRGRCQIADSGDNNNKRRLQCR